MKIDGQYWTMGAYDGVVIISADDESKALHCLAGEWDSGVRMQSLFDHLMMEFPDVAPLLQENLFEPDF